MGTTLQIFVLIIGLLAVSTTCYAAQSESWWSGFGQGNCESSINHGPGNSININCECGAGRPVTNIRFYMIGKEPEPYSKITLIFDSEDPVDINVGADSAVGSNCRVCATEFEFITNKLKNHSSVYVLFESGTGTRFSLKGSSKAIGECKPDFYKTYE